MRIVAGVCGFPQNPGCKVLFPTYGEASITLPCHSFHAVRTPRVLYRAKEFFSRIVWTFFGETDSELGVRPHGMQRPPSFFHVFMLLLYVFTSPEFPTILSILHMNLGSVTKGDPINYWRPNSSRVSGPLHLP